MANEPELGFGTYRAEHVSGAVILHADGETPTPGYKVWLQEAMIDVYPPEFTLYWEPPGGLAADVLTPFHVQAAADVPFEKKSKPPKRIHARYGLFMGAVIVSTANAASDLSTRP